MLLFGFIIEYNLKYYCKTYFSVSHRTHLYYLWSLSRIQISALLFKFDCRYLFVVCIAAFMWLIFCKYQDMYLMFMGSCNIAIAEE